MLWRIQEERGGKRNERDSEAECVSSTDLNKEIK